MQQPATTLAPEIVSTREMLTAAAAMRAYGFPLVDITEEQERLARLTDPHRQIRPATPVNYDSGGLAGAVEAILVSAGYLSGEAEPTLLELRVSRRALDLGREALLSLSPPHVGLSAPSEDTLEGYLGNALAVVRLTNGKPNTAELRSIRLLALHAVLECRRLIECAKYVDETDDGLCPWDGLVDQEDQEPLVELVIRGGEILRCVQGNLVPAIERGRPDVAVDLTSFELLPPIAEVHPGAGMAGGRDLIPMDPDHPFEGDA
jgi:hypothetical protein